jgi:hypothetical protein
MGYGVPHFIADHYGNDKLLGDRPAELSLYWEYRVELHVKHTFYAISRLFIQD